MIGVLFFALTIPISALARIGSDGGGC